MTQTSSKDLELTDVISQLAANDAGQPAGIDTLASESVADDTAVEPLSRIAQLENALESTKASLAERERSLRKEERHAQELHEQLLQQSSEIANLQQRLASSDSPASKKTGSSNPFDMVLTLSSEREAALRERKLYKDRAANAEANVEQLESDLAAAHAAAKVQVDRANKLVVRCDELQQRVAALDGEKRAHEHQLAQVEARLSADRHSTAEDVGQHAVNVDDAVATLRRLLQERNKKILELEMQLTDRAGAPTMFGGELERLAPGIFPTTIYALESLDTPGMSHKLTRPVNTIGRGKTNDISLDASSVSRFHARLLNKSDGVWLVDLQSINGCHVNGQRASTQVLNEGDLVVIGHCRFRFSVVKPYASASTAASTQASSAS